MGSFDSAYFASGECAHRDRRIWNVFAAIKADPIGFFFDCEDAGQTTVTTAEEYPVKEIENDAENTHGSHSPPLFSSLYVDEKEKTASKQQ